MRQPAVIRAAGIAAALALAACGGGEPTAAQPPGSVAGEEAPKVAAGSVALGTPSVIVTRLAVPWGLAFLPDGSALVSERDTGRIVLVGRRGGTPRQVARVDAVPGGEAGLLGLAVSPTYRTDRLVYAYYTSARDNRIVRFRLGQPPRLVFSGIPKAGNHDGGRIAFRPDGMLYVGTGDAAVRTRSQDPASLGGKILRLTPDGRPAPGNPFRGSPVWSLGHRNVQGLAWDGAKRMYATEFGQNRFDEVNRIVPGGNYGWPVVEGRGGAPRFRDPLVVWPTSQASPSGAAFVRDSLFAAALRGKRLWQVRLAGGRVQGTQAHAVGRYGRLRHVAVEPGGRALWVLTNNRDGRGNPGPTDDRILRVPLR
ncbi:MAG TPA: PQQ-dependent sugar dehydrogenase [Mycobacteriales bacterium]|nr:PQQ-dependent sugar dehydrogenase [Mycobacteriales bacterium]